MIEDPEALADVRDSWSTALTAAISVTSAFSHSLPLLSLHQRHALDIAHNATLLYAFSVLEKALYQLQREGRFGSSKPGLKALMEASKNGLPWKDYAVVDAARDRRNQVAHERRVLTTNECWVDIDAIREELLAWGVITTPQ